MKKRETIWPSTCDEKIVSYVEVSESLYQDAVNYFL